MAKDTAGFQGKVALETENGANKSQSLLTWHMLANMPAKHSNEWQAEWSF